MSLSILDNLKDPCIHVTHNHGSNLHSIIIQMPLNEISIKYYDWSDASIITYEENVLKYGIDKARSRFRILFTNITNDVDKLDNLALHVKNVNIWFEENIAQIELMHYVDTDYTDIAKYMKLRRMSTHPDRMLSYS